MIPIGFSASALKYLPPLDPVHAFAYTGQEETITNTNYSKITAKLWGGAGNGGWYGGGRWGGGGGYTIIEYPLSPGDLITVMVAQGGPFTGHYTNSPGGWPDGGSGAYGDATGGGSGGSSRVFINDVLIAVAGGGGSAAGYSAWGGSGGGLSGVDSGNGLGRPGTQTAAGLAGGAPGLYPEDNATTGATYWENGGGPITYATRFKRTGGHGGPLGGSTGGDGGAGGGGYYGGAGGSGDAIAGGGGSGFAHPNAISANLATGTGGGGDPPGMSDPVYPGNGVARGTASNTNLPGGNGFIHITLS